MFTVTFYLELNLVCPSSGCSGSQIKVQKPSDSSQSKALWEIKFDIFSHSTSLISNIPQEINLR